MKEVSICGPHFSYQFTLQTSVFAQFPSISLANMNSEDMSKLQVLINDNHSLKGECVFLKFYIIFNLNES
jgi:hypothetical protein